MSTSKEQKALRAAEEELNAGNQRLAQAKAELEKATSNYRFSRSDQDWESKRQVESRVERFTIDVQSLTVERDKTAKAFAVAKVAEYDRQLAEAAKDADLAAAWAPLLSEAAGIYERLGELSRRVVEVAQQARKAAGAYDALAAEAKEYARGEHVAAPNVPAIARQSAGSLTLQCFRETLVQRLGTAPDSRYMVVPPGQGQHEEGHLRYVATHHGTLASDDLQKWGKQMSEKAQREADAVSAQMDRESHERAQKRIDELNARDERQRANMLAEGFSEADIPPPANYELSYEQLN